MVRLSGIPSPLLILTTALALAGLFPACKPSAPPAGQAATPAPAATAPPAEKAATVADIQASLGAAIYEEFCAVCHLSGSASEQVPALRGALILSDPAALARVIHSGRQAVRQTPQGEKLSVMPGFAYLTDEELAALMTWLRSEFGGMTAGSAVTPDDAARLRVSSPR